MYPEQIRDKGVNFLVRITKQEAEYLRANSKNCKIAVTGAKKKSRHKKWYVDELPETIRLLKKFNEERKVQ